MATSLFEEMGGRYERQGDYLIPCLTVPAEEEQPIGIWGQQHLDYLKQYRKSYIHRIFLQVAGSTPTLPTSTGRRRNALSGS